MNPAENNQAEPNQPSIFQTRQNPIDLRFNSYFLFTLQHYCEKWITDTDSIRGNQRVNYSVKVNAT